MLIQKCQKFWILNLIQQQIILFGFDTIEINQYLARKIEILRRINFLSDYQFISPFVSDVEDFPAMVLATQPVPVMMGVPPQWLQGKKSGTKSGIFFRVDLGH